MMDPVTPDQIATAAESLRTVLAEIDAGALEATPAQRAHIAGSLSALEELATDA